MNMRRVVIFLDVDGQTSAPLGAEVYRFSGADSTEQIDMALLNDLHTPMELAFVGGADAKRCAALYRGEWFASCSDLERAWATVT
jgi:hypothetical protein